MSTPSHPADPSPAPLASRVRACWRRGDVAGGVLVKSCDPVHSAVLSRLGFDFLWYDLEHSDKSVETFAHLARAARGGADVMARPARWEYMRMGRLLEAGAQGILYPRCESADEAREVVRWAKFPPEGERGFDGGSLDNDYGHYPAGDYVARANATTWLAVQIESPRAVAAVDEIAAVPGVDCLFFGPGDFSALTGRPGQVKHAEVLAAAARIAASAQRAGKVFGTLVFDADHARYMHGLGAKLLVHGADILLLRQAAAGVLKLHASLGVENPVPAR